MATHSLPLQKVGPFFMFGTQMVFEITRNGKVRPGPGLVLRGALTWGQPSVLGSYCQTLVIGAACKRELAVMIAARMQFCPSPPLPRGGRGRGELPCPPSAALPGVPSPSTAATGTALRPTSCFSGKLPPRRRIC